MPVAPRRPPPRVLERYAREVQRRSEKVVDLRMRIQDLGREYSQAEIELQEANRDYREVERRWLGALMLARQLKALEAPVGTVITSRRKQELAQMLAVEAKGLNVSVAEILTYA